MAYEEEDSPPMERPRGILSGGSETLKTMGLGQMGEQMAPEKEHADAESVHAETIMEAIKTGDVEELRNALAAFNRECYRNFAKGKEP